MNRKEVYTTGEIAAICHVAARTVSKWFDSGQLRGYRIPGSRDRRVPAEALLEFLNANHMPLGQLDGRAVRVLIVDAQGAASCAVATSLSQTDRYEVLFAANGFEAGMLAEKLRPHVIVVDVENPQTDAAQIVQNVRSNPALSATRLLAAMSEPGEEKTNRCRHQGFCGTIAKPYQLSELIQAAQAVRELVA
jgi:excisionase family DNA binding protein